MHRFFPLRGNKQDWGAAMIKISSGAVLVCGLLLPLGQAAARPQTAACANVGQPFLMMQVSSRTGCPLSAVVETDRTETLADGTHIHTKTRSLVYRDSSGRIRYDINPAVRADVSGVERLEVVQIYDPVGGFLYFLQPHSKVARRRAISPGQLAPAIFRPDDRQSSAPVLKPRAESGFETLGTQEIEGIQATGTRTTTTIPAGKQGNDQPMTVVTELWQSSDLGIRILEKVSDPRLGDSETRLTGLEQAEPDPALFEVPPDYAIEDH